uniref:Uncharacterized protein n=1 Tax=Meloidogyne enterolobii TaxID=390850 RepID=A0A6V7VT93_MELEN|nr:unnamed protein product [Meloidogyne enterolobii]
MQRIKQCKVCGAKEHVGFHYGVCTCRACGSFFRRHLESEYEWKYNKCQCSPKKLSKENEDEKSPTDLTKCKKCRLEKCFSVGMKKLDVGYLRQDLCQEVIKGSKEIEQSLQIISIVDITINDQKLIDSILPIIEAKKRITHAFNDLDDIFLKGPIFFEEIISSNFNILRLVDIFSPNPSPMPLDELKRWESSLQNEGLLNTRCRKAFQVNRLLCFGIAKSMPVFEKLTLSDQIAHLRHISYMFLAFTGPYLAWELGFETWTRKDGAMPALVFKSCKYANDQRMIRWSEIAFTKSVAKFKRAELTNVEYALLIAIIFTKPGAEGLSPEGKDLLYDESSKYTNILLQYNQRRLGLLEGAQRLDLCINLINAAIETEHILRLMLLYHTKYYSMNSINIQCSNFIENLINRTD